MKISINIFISVVMVVLTAGSLLLSQKKISELKKEKQVLESRLKRQKEVERNLKEADALKKSIIDRLPVGLSVIGTDRKILALNQSGYELFNNKEPIENVIGQPATKFYYDIYKNSDEEKKKVTDILAQNKPSVEEIQARNNRIYKRSYYPLYMEEKLKGHLWIIEDITERKEMEKDILQTKEEAVRANLAKSEFLSHMSHELRTPLNAILGFAQLLEIKEPLSPQQTVFVSEILKGGRHLLQLINEILELSRVETGNIKIESDIVKVGDVLQECLNLVGPSADQKGVRLVNKLDEAENDYVYADPVRLKQIFLNLLNNGIKYNRKNGTVIISYESMEEMFTIHIRDTGIGIPQEAQKRVFEPFYRLGHPQVEGTGIGLVLVKKLVVLMGGEVGVDSKEGEGSDFWLRLPLARANQKQIYQESFETPLVSPWQQKEAKILYIEDNHSNLHLVSEIVEALSRASLKTAITGREGMQAAKQESFDLILVDLHLPDLSGFEILEILKSIPRTKHTPIIAVSANAMKDDITRALAQGFNEYITKPIDVPSFIKVISKFLDKG